MLSGLMSLTNKVVGQMPSEDQTTTPSMFESSVKD